MKLKILLLTISFASISLSLLAKPVVDSVGVKNVDGKKVVLFKVKPKDTYYSIGRRYGVKPATIMKYNNTKKETLTIGNIVKVPTDMPFRKSGKSEKTSEKVVKKTKKKKKPGWRGKLKREKKHKKKKYTEEEQEKPVTTEQPAEPEVKQPSQQPVKTAPENNAPPLQYKVSAGETLYGIAKRFNSSVDEITKLNNLTSTNIQPGTVLTIKPGSAAPATPADNNDKPIPKHDSIVLSTAMDSNKADHRLNVNKFGLYEKNENGVGTWIDDTSLDPNKKLVLHRTAPIGTVVKMTDPMTNRTTFAKVVGRFTDNEETKDVIIVMTKNVADSLGALDKRFRVDISYGSPNE